MIPFKYSQPKSLKEAADILIKEKNSLLFAGGTDILGLVKDNIIAPKELVNIKNIPGLNKINYIKGKELRIGSLVKINEIAEDKLISEKFTVLAQAAKEVASPQLRNMGTIAGNIYQRPRCWYYRGDFNCIRKGGDTCFAFDGQNKFHCIIGGGPCFIVHPSDTAVALLALDAKISILSKGKSKIIPIKEFFVLPDTDFLNENVLKQGEIIEEIIIPDLPAATKSSYVKFKERGVWDFAMVSIAAVLEPDGKKIKNGKIAFGGIAPVPWMEDSLNSKIKNLQADENSISNLSEEILKNAEPLEMNAYKIILTRNMLKRLLLDLV